MAAVSFPLVRKYTRAVSSDAIPKRPCRVRERVRSVLAKASCSSVSRTKSSGEGAGRFLQAAVVFAVQRAYLTPSKITVALSYWDKHAPTYARGKKKKG